MKTGFVTLFGRSNVGKSTLLNALVGSKIAITTPKPQTTRNQIQGVVHRPDVQIVFVDTPGIFTSARTTLSAKLNATAEQALHDIDAVVHVVDPTRPIGPEDKKILATLEQVSVPKILVINKSDIADAPYTVSFEDLGSRYTAVVRLSALNGTHVEQLVMALADVLPEGEPSYLEGQMTNVDNRFWFAELIREKLFLRLREELPYSLHVTVDEITPRSNTLLYVKARIITTDERYKRMIIGLGGRGIREIGQSTRKELESVLQQQVYLDLEVEVDPHWTEQFE